MNGSPLPGRQPGSYLDCSTQWGLPDVCPPELGRQIKAPGARQALNKQGCPSPTAREETRARTEATQTQHPPGRKPCPALETCTGRRATSREMKSQPREWPLNSPPAALGASLAGAAGKGRWLIPGSGGSLLTCSASMDPMPPLNMMGLIHSRRWPSGSWRPKERAKPGAWTPQGDRTECGHPVSSSAHLVTHHPHLWYSVSVTLDNPSLTGQHWLPKLVAVIRSPITGLNGDLQGSGKVLRILEVWILPRQVITWKEIRKLAGPLRQKTEGPESFTKSLTKLPRPPMRVERPILGTCFRKV